MPNLNRDLLNFYILKYLKESPTHGYELFILLKDKQLVKQPSTLYKILRSMDKKGILVGNKEPSETGGPNKTIFRLSEKGIEEYYRYIFSSIRLLLDVFGDMQNKIMYKHRRDSFQQIGLDLEDFLVKKNFYLDMPMGMPLRSQIELIQNIDKDLGHEGRIYLKVKSERERKLIEHLSNTKISVQILDENIQPMPNTIDLVFSMQSNNSTEFEKKLQEFVRMLNKEGSLILLKPKLQDFRRFSQISKEFSTLFSDIPENIYKMFSDILPMPNFMKTIIPLERSLSKEDLKETLEKYFREIREGVFDNNQFIFYAKNPIKR